MYAITLRVNDPEGKLKPGMPADVTFDQGLGMKRTAFPWLYLGLGFAQAAHSIEEVLAGLWIGTWIASRGILHLKLSLDLRMSPCPADSLRSRQPDHCGTG